MAEIVITKEGTSMSLSKNKLIVTSTSLLLNMLLYVNVFSMDFQEDFETSSNVSHMPLIALRPASYKSSLQVAKKPIHADTLLPDAQEISSSESEVSKKSHPSKSSFYSSRLEDLLAEYIDSYKPDENVQNCVQLFVHDMEEALNRNMCSMHNVKYTFKDFLPSIMGIYTTYINNHDPDEHITNCLNVFMSNTFQYVATGNGIPSVWMIYDILENYFLPWQRFISAGRDDASPNQLRPTPPICSVFFWQYYPMYMTSPEQFLQNMKPQAKLNPSAPEFIPAAHKNIEPNYLDDDNLDAKTNDEDSLAR